MSAIHQGPHRESTQCCVFHTPTLSMTSRQSSKMLWQGKCISLTHFNNRGIQGAVIGNTCHFEQYIVFNCKKKVVLYDQVNFFIKKKVGLQILSKMFATTKVWCWWHELNVHMQMYSTITGGRGGWGGGRAGLRDWGIRKQSLVFLKKNWSVTVGGLIHVCWVCSRGTFTYSVRHLWTRWTHCCISKFSKSW